MNAKTFPYNLSGHGKIEIELYDYAQKYLEFMEDINVIDRLANTDQLGALTNVHHGAHYTRYEYVLLQWYLIYKVNDNLENTGFNSNKDDFGKVNRKDPPTVAEILQSLALLANMGHFPDTFAASKLWLHLLNNNEVKVRTVFRKGLKANIQDEELKGDLSNLLDSIIDSFDLHKIHVLNAIFLLRRYRRRRNRKELIDLGVRLLVDYLKYTSGKEKFESNLNFKEYWEKYTKIRRLSYLFLDSSYAPIPFKMDLPTIIINLEQFFDNSIGVASTLNEMIQEINSLLQHSLYLSGKSMITSTKRSRELEKNFYEMSQKEDFSKFSKFSTIKNLIDPEKQDEEDNEIRVFEQSEWSHSIERLQASSTIFVLSYQGSVYIKIAPYDDLFQWEKKIQKKCRKQTCNVSVHKNPDGTILKIALELDNKRDFIHQRNSLLNFTSYIIGLDEELTDAIPGTPEQSISENNTILVEQILNLVFQRKFSFKLSSPNAAKIPIFYGQGSTKVSNQVSEYLDTLGRELEEHEEHEMSMMKKYLKDLDYEGYVIAFGGKTEPWKYNSSSQDGEFDGVIVLPNRENYLTILEAKNTSHGRTDSKNQLEDRLEKLEDDLDGELPSYSINTFKKAAFARFYENKAN